MSYQFLRMYCDAAAASFSLLLHTSASRAAASRCGRCSVLVRLTMKCRASFLKPNLTDSWSHICGCYRAECMLMLPEKQSKSRTPATRVMLMSSQTSFCQCQPCCCFVVLFSNSVGDWIPTHTRNSTHLSPHSAEKVQFWVDLFRWHERSVTVVNALIMQALMHPLQLHFALLTSAAFTYAFCR